MVKNFAFVPANEKNLAKPNTNKIIYIIHSTLQLLMSLSLVIVAFVVLLTPGGGVQAVFAPVNGDALMAAVGDCTQSWNGERYDYACTGGCLGETSNGSCPIFAASNDATGNPYGVMGDWDVSQVTNFDSSTPNLYLFVLFVPLACGSLTILGFFFSCVWIQHQLHTPIQCLNLLLHSTRTFPSGSLRR